MSQKFCGIRCFSAGLRPFTNHAFIGQKRPVLQLFHRFLCKTIVFVDELPRTFSLFEDFFKQGFRFGEIPRNPPTFCPAFVTHGPLHLNRMAEWPTRGIQPPSPTTAAAAPANAETNCSDNSAADSSEQPSQPRFTTKGSSSPLST